MFSLRRTALRAALSATKPTPSLVVPKTRTFVSLNHSKLRPARQWSVSSVQRRFASEGTERAPEKQAESAESSAAALESTEPAQVVEEVVTRTAVEAETPAEAVSHESRAPMGDVSGLSASEATAEVASAVGGSGPAAPSPYARGAGGLPSPNTTVYVGNIFFEVNEQSLSDYFARYGQITKTRIVYDARGLSKGFGYVEFENIDDAVRAVEAANQQVFQGRRLAVQFHRPRQPINGRNPRDAHAPSKTLFIGNMSFEMSDKELSDLFRDVRNVIDVRIAIDRRTGQPRGFAHADFIDVASATKAMEFLKGKELYGRRLRVDFTTSTPHNGTVRRE